jgi:hypothetical protein
MMNTARLPGRNYAIKVHADLKPIRDNYANLYDASRYARYDGESYKDYPDEVRDLLEIDLVAIREHIQQLIEHES